jgi:hypothetical protein
MSNALSVSNDALTISLLELCAIARRAHFVAALVAHCVDAAYAATGIDRATIKSCPFSAGYLLELAAVMQLRLWEDAGLTIHIDAGLLSADAASKELERRSQVGESEFDLTRLDLWRKVNRVWFKHIAWESQEIFGAEIALTQTDDDVLDDALADLLWKNRHIAKKDAQR